LQRQEFTARSKEIKVSAIFHMRASQQTPISQFGFIEHTYHKFTLVSHVCHVCLMAAAQLFPSQFLQTNTTAEKSSIRLASALFLDLQCTSWIFNECIGGARGTLRGCLPFCASIKFAEIRWRRRE
jgi:hypothetical protein